MKNTKILLVSDGGVTSDLMKKMFILDKYGAEVTMIEDKDMYAMGDITDRMLQLEKGGVDAVPTCKPLLNACMDKDIIVVHGSYINKEIINASKNLKVVAVLRDSYENADIEALTKRGIKLINAQWRSAYAVADFTVGMMIAANKNIAHSYKLICEGKWCKKYVNQEYIHDMRTCTVGIIGFGYIGRQVVQRLSGFGSKIIVYDPFMSPWDIAKAGYKPVTFEELLAQSDFVTVHMSLTEETNKFIGEKEFSQMKTTAYFINTSRAGIVDTNALIHVLQRKSIGGAAIDVFDEEPLPSDSPLIKLDNVTLTSHLAGISCDTMLNSVEIVLDDLKKYMHELPMQNIRN
ncbi:2-hydroxyacid dehydrogenase [Clostridium estertheticum]|uniref:2-hydroxyacid dehydrogenase n=1 Tax=Clostridium estertheticum TaxID=238834 RepID=UPI001CF3597C|nr:2-hydroxyacid dehydrogenase [Clostridium estertheticum]MCB2354531.1 2-hydroxyacid dehydrogenase [Clostridium estertheticum]WAG42359.1 2-hydroxyacid dehydrogenase [Clostridium estertheticum]